MLERAIRLLVILQFALVMAFPCRCVTNQIAQQSAPSVQATCCAAKSCMLSHSSVEQRATESPTVQSVQGLCMKSPRRSTCPGRLLPELSPPPLPLSDLSLLLASHASPTSFADDGNSIHRPPCRRILLRPPSLPSPDAHSLVRLHCALIV
jgi:hypothetical protein